jgi:hypothetical protein
MHHRRKHRTRKHRRMRGGSAMFGNSYEPVTNSSGSSAWSHVSGLVGGLDEQYNGALMGNSPGNQLPINARTMSGGRRRSRTRSRRHRRRGGSLMSAVGTAVVPLGLLALQQTYKNRKRRKMR